MIIVLSITLFSLLHSTFCQDFIISVQDPYWSPIVLKKEKKSPYSQWRTMGDRGSTHGPSCPPPSRSYATGHKLFCLPHIMLAVVCSEELTSFLRHPEIFVSSPSQYRWIIAISSDPCVTVASVPALLSAATMPVNPRERQTTAAS